MCAAHLLLYNLLMTTLSTCPEQSEAGRWTVGGAFLDALARRDFAAVGACLAPDVRFRALVPPGLLEEHSADSTLGHLRRWFGAADRFDLTDAALGQVGSLLYLHWRARTAGATGPVRAVEQHVYARVDERIVTFDLLCSGFHEDDGNVR
jgi:hypothetical protein